MSHPCEKCKRATSWPRTCPTCTMAATPPATFALELSAQNADVYHIAGEVLGTMPSGALVRMTVRR